MQAVQDAVYPLVVWCVQKVKIGERALIRLFRGQIERLIRSKFRGAGITVNGNSPCDLKIYNKDFFTRLGSDFSLGVGEAYMDGWFDCDALDEFSFRVFTYALYLEKRLILNRFFNYILYHVFNLQTKSRAFEVGEKHYDQGNDLFEAFLDSNMNYSCGYWKNAKNLEEAQINKMELIAQKLKLKPGMKVLDIGCGWAGLCKYLATNYHVQMVGITVSEEGAKIGRKRCKGLPVEIRVQDYRDLNEKFDRIVSVGMFEHVGPANYKIFFDVTNRCLEEDGIFLLHTIGVNHKRLPRIEPFFNTYIFPNGCLPYYKDIPDAIEGLYVIEDWHNFGNDYNKTLMAWHENFVKAWPKKLAYKGERFYRMWKFYLLMAAGAFRSRKYQLWQVVLTKNGYPGGYDSVR